MDPAIHHRMNPTLNKSGEVHFSESDFLLYFIKHSPHKKVSNRACRYQWEVYFTLYSDFLYEKQL